MTKIRVMSENLANKIAAGEVVEKCASIVKELVENSIDAHAKVIKVSLKEGGIKEIMVTDDGIGMEKEDAKLAFLRHATSKIYKDDDLFFINTLGFRGEALPSIASVSEVVLKTCSTDVGTNVHIKGGALLDVSSSDAKKGTSIKITNLFYNTPARLKYLKSEQSELQNCVSYLEKLAISKPQISFSLENDDKVLVKTSGSGNLLKTINEIYGLNVAKNMLEIKGSNDDFDIRGFVCKPEILRSNRNHIITIVNDRIVKNAEINKAINDAYYTYKPESKYPIVVICIETDPTLIDVNIHPTKQDIKLSKMNVLTELIEKKIKDALYQNLLIKNVSVTKEEAPLTYEDKKEKTISNIKEVESIYQTSMEFDYQDVSIKEEEIPKEKNEVIKTIDLKTVGIAHATYIIAQNDEGIYLIDQHAAQERINYEKYIKALKEEKTSTTDMLFPIKIEYSPSEYLILKEQTSFINSLGFQIEEFGINTILVKNHPTWLLMGHEEESIRKIFDLIIINKNNFDRVKYNEKIAITLACKMSIKANMRITLEDADRLLQDLVKCDNPYNCPHGRPTIIKFTIYELEKMFKRVMN
ncbi:MAG: DNA mismatch repair endonuclease MutL [Bacilli bacterium]|nr:DNA mismatch repair endonuclease MutL [Bacilli bacterium]